MLANFIHLDFITAPPTPPSTVVEPAATHLQLDQKRCEMMESRSSSHTFIIPIHRVRVLALVVLVICVGPGWVLLLPIRSSHLPASKNKTGRDLNLGRT